MRILVEKTRLAKDLSLSELSRRSGVAKSHIASIESGEKCPTVLILAKIARGLRVPTSSLIED